MNFASIPGLTEIKKTLIDGVRNNHIAHAQLFSGKPGALNLPMALAFSQYMHCQQRSDLDSCGQCPGCVKSLKYVHPDTQFVFPLNNVEKDKDEDRFKAEITKSFRSFLLENPFGNLNDWVTYYGGEDKQPLISKEESREIIKNLSLKPFESPYKFMIIWQPEFMHPSASNGILKLLEEPPVNTFFLLVSNAEEQLMPTIISRTQKVQVPLLEDSEIADFLKSKVQDQSRIVEVVQMAKGDLNEAQKLLESEADHHQEQFIEWMRLCYKKEYSRLVAMAEEFHEKSKLHQYNLLSYGLTMMREILLQASGASQINSVKEGEIKFVKYYSKVMDPAKIEKVHNLITDSSYYLERNGSAKMIFLDLSLQLSQVMSHN